MTAPRTTGGGALAARTCARGLPSSRSPRLYSCGRGEGYLPSNPGHRESSTTPSPATARRAAAAVPATDPLFGGGRSPPRPRAAGAHRRAPLPGALPLRLRGADRLAHAGGNGAARRALRLPHRGAPGPRAAPELRRARRAGAGGHAKPGRRLRPVGARQPLLPLRQHPRRARAAAGEGEGLHRAGGGAHALAGVPARHPRQPPRGVPAGREAGAARLRPVRGRGFSPGRRGRGARLHRRDAARLYDGGDGRGSLRCDALPVARREREALLLTSTTANETASTATSPRATGVRDCCCTARAPTAVVLERCSPHAVQPCCPRLCSGSRPPTKGRWSNTQKRLVCVRSTVFTRSRSRRRSRRPRLSG